MKKVISSEKIPIKMWLEQIETDALQQAKNLANLPFAFRHVAIMPDCHLGYGMPIGGVLATENIVIPNAVGVDIGCGMCAAKSNLVRIRPGTFEEITEKIRQSIPRGFDWHTRPQPQSEMPDRQSQNSLPVVWKQFKRARRQLGTLGGGNHFIEIQQDRNGCTWIMVHSGSRNIGKQVADHYNRIAIELNKRQGTEIPKKWQLASLPLDSPEAKRYLAEMKYCVKFALASRHAMMRQVQRILENFYPRIHWDQMINIAHNYASSERHFDHRVMVHRKGATQAQKGQLGIIPGSQGAKSYIVRGKGNPESFMSCSHGAGRRMGRRQAIRELDLEKEKAFLDAQGIIHSMTERKKLDEAAGAYKEIGKVMKNQQDLVEIVAELTPRAVIKG